MAHGRVRLKFARDLEVDFVDRDRALSQIEEIADMGTRFPLIIYSPEGCGKTAFLKQAREVLEKDFSYSVVYTNPLAESTEEIIQYTKDIKNIAKDLLELFPEPISKAVDVAISIAGIAMRRFRKSRIAVLMDDIFQAVGVDRAEIYVKALLNLIEYPPGDYENIVVVVSSSEGTSRERIGRHRWTTFRMMWNMPKEGFKRLYDALPGDKPSFEDAWKWTGGNPSMLAKLMEAGWDVDVVVKEVEKVKSLYRLVGGADRGVFELFGRVVEDLDAIFRGLRDSSVQGLERRLIELNLVIDVWGRDDRFWIDIPPPEKDLELGIGNTTHGKHHCIERLLEGL